MLLKVLGSVSPYCKNNLNCPGYLVICDNKKYLLDCGNGVTRNLNFPDDLKDLTIIISHLHNDHFGDLLTIAYASFVYHNLNMLEEKVKVYLPKDESTTLEFLKSIDENYFEINFYDEDTIIEDEEVTITFRKTIHPVKTFSIKVEDKDSTLIYSSDTGFKNNNLESFSQNADLLICETTFLKNQKGEVDNHLTTLEAGEIAKKANVKRLMINHFFPEIDKSLYLEETKTVFENTFVSQEGKVLKLGGKN